MIATLIAAVAALASQVQEPGKPKVDRTGESAFREMLAKIAGRTSFHGFILKSYREGGREDFYPEGLIEIWRDREKFRIEFGDMWGSSNIVVCDGTRVLDDHGSDPVVIKNRAKNWVESSTALSEHGPASSPWFFLMEGPAVLERLDKDRSLTQDQTTKSILWDSSKFGKLTIRHVSESKALDIWELEYDNMPWQRDMFKLAPEWFDAPNPTALWRQKVVVMSAKFPRGIFDTKVAKGRTVDDQTKSAKKPPRLY